MSAYLSSLIGRLSGEGPVFSPAAPSKELKSPEISTITLFNPKWASGENIDELKHQILFFETDTDVTEANEASKRHDSQKETNSANHTRETEDEHQSGSNSNTNDVTALNIVGLLRGSQALADELGGSSEPLVVLLSGGAFIVEEIEQDFFLACFVAIPPHLKPQQEAVVAHVRCIMVQIHAGFSILHPPIQRLEKLFGRQWLSDVLQLHWMLWRNAFNASARSSFGPLLLAWPNQVNPHGFLGMFPGGHQLLDIEVSSKLKACVDSIVEREADEETQRETEGEIEGVPEEEAEGAVDGIEQKTEQSIDGLDLPKSNRPETEMGSDGGINNLAVRPSAVLLSLMSRPDHELPPKYRGLAYLTGELAQEDMFRVAAFLQFLASHNQLEEPLSLQSVKEMFCRMEKELKTKHSEPEAEPAAASTAISPFTPTFAPSLDSLRPENLADTLVLPFTYSLSGLRMLGQAVNEQILAPWRTEQAAEPETEAEPEPEQGTFITGADHGQFLIYLGSSAREYLLVLYLHGSALIALVYESGLPKLGLPDFYEELKEKLDLAADSLGECVTQTTGQNNHVSSTTDGATESEVETNGSETSSIQTPSANAAMTTPTFGPTQSPSKHSPGVSSDNDFFYFVYDRVHHSYQSSLPPLESTALFHLHDQLIDHFLIKKGGNAFASTGAAEHLHKFSSTKTNDWLFYVVRQEQKFILVIRNYNRRRPRESEHVRPVTKSYAHLGFIDSLGDDVRAWLERFV